MFAHHTTLRPAALAGLMLGLVAACGEPRFDAPLPEAETVYLPSPGELRAASSGLEPATETDDAVEGEGAGDEGVSSTAETSEGSETTEVDGGDGQASCDRGFHAMEKLETWIEAYNEPFERVMALVDRAREEARFVSVDEDTWEARIEGEVGTMVIEATIEPDDTVRWNFVFEGPMRAQYKFLRGTMSPERTSGTWESLKPNGQPFSTATWTRRPAGMSVVRTLPGRDRTASYRREGDAITVVFSGVRHEASAQWNRTAGTGSFTINGDTKVCWDTALCTRECPAGE